jgi:hypothetical protein
MQMMAYRAGTVENSSIVDRLRGVSSTTTEKATSLRTSATGAEYVSPLLSQLWNNTGFNLPSGISGGSDIFWSFKRAPGFFDEVCYTGTGSATTQAHNLTVVPELIIVKERSAANDWWVYVSSVGNTKYSVLNSTAIPTTSSTAWNNTTPTASVFSIGTGSNVNASTQTFVAYLFATLAGISKVGSYTGNGGTSGSAGTSQTINCGFAAGARFIMIRRTDAGDFWYVWDTARGIVAGTDPYGRLNSTADDITTDDSIDPDSSGFIVNQLAATNINVTSATYIYLAIA